MNRSDGGVRPKYSIPEIERRWLAIPANAPVLDATSARSIEDLYVDDSRLRVRQMRQSDGSTLYKLGKKYGAKPGDFEPITNIYLESKEYERLNLLDGCRSSKLRYSIAGGSFDVYQLPSPGLALFEVELEDEDAASRFVPPPFVGREITGHPLYTGAALAAAARANRREAADATIYHLTPVSGLRAGLAATSYLPVRFAQDGFVHCAATPNVTLAVARDYFRASTEPVIVLAIATTQLTSRLLFEPPAPLGFGGREHLVGTELFPHIYGPIDRSAITGAALLRRDGNDFHWPARFDLDLLDDQK